MAHSSAPMMADCPGRATRLDNRRFPPEFLDAVVDDGQERRETCKQEEEKIQVGMVPSHAQLQRNSRPKGQ
jgi:hypothetical protein